MSDRSCSPNVPAPAGRSRRARRWLGLALAAVVLCPAAGRAQPFLDWFDIIGPDPSGLRVPDNPALNPTGAFTFEAWVATPSVTGGCLTIAGKDYKHAWWVGICAGNQLRSFLKGASSSRTQGFVDPNNYWNHVAVVFDGSTRKHYVNGELVATWPETGPLTTSNAPLEIGNDVSFTAISYPWSVDEVRLWKVARSESQIRSTINVPIHAAMPGLVAVWNFDGSPAPGSQFGGQIFGTVEGDSFGPGEGCTPGANSNATTFCFLDQFLVTASFRNGPPGTGVVSAQTVPTPADGSGNFWFFNANDWEILAKAINGCPVSNTFWFFSAATTNLNYRIFVYDRINGEQRIYLNYGGPPAPAVNDTNAFVNCP